jgi:NAD(P)H-hydrate epimerase
MMPDSRAALTRERVRELDRVAIRDYGIPGVVLMENAGRACTEAALDMLAATERSRVLVLCGKGNNGGDGYVVARNLWNRGAGVRVIALGSISDMQAAENDAAVNLHIALKMEIPLRECTTADDVRVALGEGDAPDLIVDAMLGTGISGEVREPYRTAIEVINEMAVPVLAVDLPSGMDCDTGLPLGVAVRAERTVTFVAPKAGFDEPGASDYTGEVTVAEIGIPRDLLPSPATSAEDLEPQRPQRPQRKATAELTGQVIGCAINVHRALGPGLLESAYQQCLAHEFHRAGIPFGMKVPVPVTYEGLKLDCGYRLDFLVDGQLVVEVKSVQALGSTHRAQMLTYLRLTGIRLGLLINFNEVLLRKGIVRMAL